VLLSLATPLPVSAPAAVPQPPPLPLTADLSGLPSGHHAVFAAGPGDTTGTLVWTPTYDDAGSYSVRFTASNALSGSATIVISVGNVDRSPVVAAPAGASTSPGHLLTVLVHAADPDGEPLGSLAADLSGLPAGHAAAFATGPGDSVGTLTWTPAPGDAGSYPVHFTAANAVPGSAATAV